MQKGQTGILILTGIVLVIALVGGAYYLGRQASSRPSPPPVISQTPQPTSPLCTAEKAEILTLISNFESLQIKRDALGILVLFTSAVSSEDIDTYNFFAGKKTGTVGLYGNVTTNINMPSYKITGDPIANQNGCTVTVAEQRRPFSNAGPIVGFGAPETFHASFDVTKQGNEWKIDKYYPTGQTPSKYSAWGY